MQKATKISLIITLLCFIVINVRSNYFIIQKNNDMNLKSLEIEHSTPSLGGLEAVEKSTLLATKNHIKTINNFINHATINKTTPLYDYLQAIKTKDKEKTLYIESNLNHEALAVGETVTNLSFIFEDGQVITMRDVYRVYNLTELPNFEKYIKDNGSTNHYNFSSFDEEENIEAPIDLSNDTSYSDEQVIVKLAKTPGLPESTYYQLLIYGNGDYIFKNVSR